MASRCCSNGSARPKRKPASFGLREGQLRSAGRLAAEFAHQIKNPLAIINNAAYSLQRALKQGKPGAEQLRIIQEEVEHSDRIITQIMGYAQLTEGRVEKLDVHQELDYAIDRVFPRAAGFTMKVHRDYTGSFPPLLMQRRHLSDSLINVLQNARDALDGQGGNIWVTARTRSDYAIEVCIRDDGQGIPPTNRKEFSSPTTAPRKKAPASVSRPSNTIWSFTAARCGSNLSLEKALVSSYYSCPNVDSTPSEN